MQHHADSRSLYLYEVALAIVKGALRFHPREEAASFACSSSALLGSLSCPGRSSRLNTRSLLGSCLGCCSFGLRLSGSAGGLRSSRRRCSGDCCSIGTGANLGTETRFSGAGHSREIPATSVWILLSTWLWGRINCAADMLLLGGGAKHKAPKHQICWLFYHTKRLSGTPAWQWHLHQ